MKRAAVLAAIAAFAIVRAQTPNQEELTVLVSNEVADDVEKRYTPELVSKVLDTKNEALLLYTEYSARTAGELKAFLKNMTTFSKEALSANDITSYKLDVAPTSCKDLLEYRMKKIQYDAQRIASFSAENHHKFFLGHMIVIRMHLNKSEYYVQKCEKALILCGGSCETSPKIRRWRRLAHNEVNRARDDLQHSRRSFHDLVVHAHRKLNTTKKQAFERAHTVAHAFLECVTNGGEQNKTRLKF